MRITELANDVTAHIDAADALQFVRALRAVDEQLFVSFRGEAGLMDDECVAALLSATRAAKRVLDKGGRVVLMGCGTSGRICHLIGAEYAALGLDVTGVISGGLASLVMSNELPEDDPKAGAADYLAALGERREHAMVIGVSCGLSADYVAGAVQCALERGHAAACFGFNHPRDARTPLFRSVLDTMATAERSDWTLLTPIVGPEAIAGSSRMKGGSGAFIWLDAMFSAIHNFSSESAVEADLRSSMKKQRQAIQQYYERATTALAGPLNAMRAAMQQQTSGTVVLLAETPATALYAVFGCSEMVDTYGFERLRFRAIVADNEEQVGNALKVGDAWNAAATEANAAEVLALSATSVSPDLDANSFIISITGDIECNKKGKELAKKLSCSHATIVCEGESGTAVGLKRYLPLKLALDAITTYAGIHAGFVVRNRMINLTVANAKLRERAIKLIALLAECSFCEARTALRRVIYQDADLSEIDKTHVPMGKEDPDVVEHEVRLATEMRLVVPSALKLAREPCMSVHAARTSVGAAVTNSSDDGSEEIATDSRMFGVVEGAYGPLWTDQERFHVIDLMMRASAAAERWAKAEKIKFAPGERPRRLNCYLFGPKDDDGTRVSWRDLLQPNGVQRLRRTAAFARTRGVEFVVALHVGDELQFSVTQDQEAALRARVRQLRDECAVDGVALFFDDVNLPLDGDSAAMRTAWTQAASAQAKACGAMCAEWNAASGAKPARFLMCPSVYHTNDARSETDAYLSTLGNHLSQQVDVLWTGHDIVSRALIQDSVSTVNQQLQRRVIIWDNVVTNDYDATRCFLGPIQLRAPTLLRDGFVKRNGRSDGDSSCWGVTGGFLLNNTVAAALFDLPMMSLGRYVAAPHHYSAHDSLKALVDAWRLDAHGADGLQLDEALLLVDLFKTPFDDGVVVPRLSSRMDRLLRNPDADCLPAVLADLDRIAGLYEKVVAMRNRALVEALHAPLWPLKEQALMLARLFRRSPNDWLQATLEEDVDPEAGVWRGGTTRRLASHVHRTPVDGARVLLCTRAASVPANALTASDTPRFAIERFDAKKHPKEALRHICIATGDEGADGTARLDDDPDCYPEFFTLPYVDESVVPSEEMVALVAVDRASNNKVVGYCLGVRDSAKFFAACRQSYFKQIAPSTDSPLFSKNAKECDLSPSEGARLALLNEVSGEEQLDALQQQFYDEYPAHMHIDLLQQAQGHGLGSRMVKALFELLNQSGTLSGVHLTAAESNMRARQLYEKVGMKVLLIEDGDCIMGKKF